MTRNVVEYDARKYRFVGKAYKTRWRPIPKDGPLLPSKYARAKLGEGYSLQLRGLKAVAEH